MSNKHFSFNVPRVHSGSRLDVCLASYIDICYSRSYSSSLIRSGFISVSGRQKKPSYKVREGELVHGFIPKIKSIQLTAEPIPLKVIYEDSSILVINKDANIVVHPSPGHCNGTIVNAMMYLCKDLQGISGNIRPGIVHRLDKNTTGLLIVAKNSKSLINLSSQFKNRTVVKKYMAIVYGVPSNKIGKINFAIGRHVNDRKIMSINSSVPRPAETLWHVLEAYGKLASLLELNIKTGRTHQIRVHCKAIGHPVIGDPTYKNKGQKRELLKNKPKMDEFFNQIKRQMLHAYKIELKHPEDNRSLEFKAKIPSDMMSLLAKLRKQ